MRILYAISEVSEGNDPLEGGAYAIYKDVRKMLSNFEHWYEDVNHIVLSSDKKSYKMFFDKKNRCMDLKLIEISETNFNIFLNWLSEYFTEVFNLRYSKKDIIAIISDDSKIETFFN
jgi:hypothetical protein